MKEQHINLCELIEKDAEVVFITMSNELEPKAEGYAQGDFRGNRTTIKYVRATNETN